MCIYSSIGYSPLNYYKLLMILHLVNYDILIDLIKQLVTALLKYIRDTVIHWPVFLLPDLLYSQVLHQSEVIDCTANTIHDYFIVVLWYDIVLSRWHVCIVLENTSLCVSLLHCISCGYMCVYECLGCVVWECMYWVSLCTYTRGWYVPQSLIY